MSDRVRADCPHMDHRDGSPRDVGFTLIELLVVIVVLGVLATITVFAVRGIADQGSEAACDADLDILVKAQEVHYVRTGSFGDEASLVTGGSLTSESTMYDTVGDASGYTITPAAGSECTSGSSSGTPASPVIPPAVTMVNYDPLNGVPAWRYLDGDLGGADDQIVVLGRDGGKADWVAADDADITTSRRTHFIDMDTLTAGVLTTLFGNVSTNGLTTVVVFTDDDTGTLSGAGVSIAEFVQAEISSFNGMSYVAAQYGGGQLASVIGGS